MATRTFELTTTVEAEPAAVIDFLMDLNRHRGMHPFLVSAEVTDTGVSDAGPWTLWRVTERPRLGPIRYTIRFPARMTRTSESSMLGDVEAGPGCTLLTDTHAVRIDAGTTVTEKTTVRAPRPLLGYMASQAQVAHARTYSLLASELQAQT